MKNPQGLQAIVSLAALVCLVAGWVNIFPENITTILTSRVFYILVGITFILQATSMTKKGYTYAMYVFGGASIIGAMFPYDSPLVTMKTVGLLGGVILSLLGRARR